MSNDRIGLTYWSGAPSVGVRELTGQDEQLIADTSTRTAVRLLSRVIEATPDWQAEDLTASDRDRLLGAIYRRGFGSRIESTQTCMECGSPFDLSLSLDELTQALERAARASNIRRLDDGSFETQSGVRFRLPTAREEIAVAENASAEVAAQRLAEWSILEAPPGVNAIAAVEEAVEEVAPVVDIDITTACPECGASQVLRFDLQFYVLQAILQERLQLLREMHRIASAYGWSHQEILDLRRSERRGLVDLIDAELVRRRR
jgi:hypothetical protein